MSSTVSLLRRSAIGAFRSALLVASGIFAVGSLRILMGFLFAHRWHGNLLFVFGSAITIATFWFLALWLYLFVSLLRDAPALDIFESEMNEADRSENPLTGFVAMEYFWLILNRTFVVFIAPDGLYGWKALGPVSNADRNYFEPLAEMLRDPELMRDVQAIQKLSKLPGGFFIPRAQIADIDLIDKQKWGMGGIPHSGRIVVRLLSGKSRELILLGSLYSDSIREQILQQA